MRSQFFPRDFVLCLGIACGCAGLVGHAVAEEAPKPTATPPAAPVAAATEEAEQSVEKLTEVSRKAVVVIRVAGRDGRQQALGSGVIVDKNGLIATNLHVIGEGRPISVELADKRKFDATVVEAFDRPWDLALIRIDAKDLPTLPLGDSDTLKQGQSIVAIGNPLGLTHSVVAGVVSGTREIDGRSMIQLAIPIEPGNSGGPLLDRQGRVHGLLTMKSAVTENLGFAVPVNALKPLMAKPNPTLMSRWLTIGTLDAEDWTPLFGAKWRQRAGRIQVSGLGSGFGGRSLCLSSQAPPAAPFEVSVAVKLESEDGAAGLVFCSNGNDVHYGFYPTAGKLRLSRFDGPDVFSWKVLIEQPSEHYRPKDWNLLKVKFEPGKIQCFVNGQLALESTDAELNTGKVGLAKFRDTEAEFRGFQMGHDLEGGLTADLTNQIAALLPAGSLNNVPAEVTAKLAEQGANASAVLREQALLLEQRAALLRSLALTVHQKRVHGELTTLFAKPEEEVDLFQAALLVARLDNEEVDVAAYQADLQRLVRQVKEKLAADADDAAKLATLQKFLFEEQGFHGSRGDYYHKSNSYVNEVLDDREGLPITLAVVYMELARHLGVKVVGVGFPGHFMVRHETEATEKAKLQELPLIDPFENGKIVTPDQTMAAALRATGRPLRDSDLAAITKRAIITRMLHNLLGLAQEAQDLPGMLRYLDAILLLAPDLGQDRFLRAAVHYQLNHKPESLVDVDWILEHRPEGVDLNRLQQLRDELTR